MNWQYKLERKFGRFGIPHLMMYVTATMLAVFLANMIMPSLGVFDLLDLYWAGVMRGQVWRVLTFAFIPASTNILMFVISLFFYYFVGNTLEQSWGSFRFTLYYLCGILFHIVAAAISGYANNTYLNLSLFFALACLYPDIQFRVYFLIPVKAKHLAYLNAALYLIALIVNDWPGRLSVIASLLNFFLFFGPDFINKLRNNRRYASSRRRFRKEMKSSDEDFWR